MDNCVMLIALFSSAYIVAAYPPVKYDNIAEDQYDTAENIDTLDSELYAVDEIYNKKDKINTYGHDKIEVSSQNVPTTQKSNYKPETTRVYQFRQHTVKPSSKLEISDKEHDPLHRYKEAINRLINKYKQDHNNKPSLSETEESTDFKDTAGAEYLSTTDDQDFKTTTKRYNYYHKKTTPNKNTTHHYYTRKYSLATKKQPLLTTTPKYRHFYNNQNYNKKNYEETTSQLPENIKYTTYKYKGTNSIKEAVKDNSDSSKDTYNDESCVWLQNFVKKLKINGEMKTSTNDSKMQYSSESNTDNEFKSEPEISSINKHTTPYKKLYGSYHLDNKNENKDYYSDDSEATQKTNYNGNRKVYHSKYSVNRDS